jgi:hypothetical protein
MRLDFILHAKKIATDKIAMGDVKSLFQKGVFAYNDV